MNILIAGKPNSFVLSMINKFRKEQHRVYILTGDNKKSGTKDYPGAFHVFPFNYTNSNLPDIFRSITPNITIFTGAFDANFETEDHGFNAVRFASGSMSLLTGFATLKTGRFIFLSSHEVFSQEETPERKTERDEKTSGTVKGIALSTFEQICRDYRNKQRLDVMTLRIDHLCMLSGMETDVRQDITDAILGYTEQKPVSLPYNGHYTVLSESDAVEYVYRIGIEKNPRHGIYHLAGNDVTSLDVAHQALDVLVDSDTENTERERPFIPAPTSERYLRLDGSRYFDEFKSRVFHAPEEIIRVLTEKLWAEKKNEEAVPKEKKGSAILRILKILFPYLESLVVFILISILSSMAISSTYFAKVDLYLLYVLLFACIYGQPLAVFSSFLSTVGYCYVNMQATGANLNYLLSDTNTYIWVAQLFAVGLVVGYMRNRIDILRVEQEEEMYFAKEELNDIHNINNSNVSIKNAMENIVITQEDNIGKISKIVGKLDRYTADEVLFEAVDAIREIMYANDVAIYAIVNDTYARLISASSDRARAMGVSVKYMDYPEIYRDLSEENIFLNRSFDTNLPMMAAGIYENDALQIVVMVWDVAFERMTLGQANILRVSSSLIQRSYMKAINQVSNRENIITDAEEFTNLIRIHKNARERNLSTSEILKLEPVPDVTEALMTVKAVIRETDYVGQTMDGDICIILNNIRTGDETFVMRKLEAQGLTANLL